MKRNIRLLGLFVAIIALLSACGGNDSGIDPDTTSLEGILLEQSADTDMLGSHVLTDEKGVQTALRSTSINLSNRQYLNNKVSLMGAFNMKDEVFEVNGVSVLEVLDKENSKAKLKEYKNTDLGFRLDYYDDWKISESVDEVSFFAPEDNGFQNEVLISQLPYSFTSVIDDEGKESSALLTYFSEKHPEVSEVNSLMRRIGVDGMEAVELSENEETNVYLYRNGLIYVISFVADEGVSEAVLNENKRTFREMLNAFRFLGFSAKEGPDGEDVAIVLDEDFAVGDGVPQIEQELSIFASKPYHFQASYPKSWYYSGATSTDSGVLHHYGFSNEADGEEIIRMDILASELPSGSNISLNGLSAVDKSSGAETVIYVNSEDLTYKFSGPTEYRDLILNMAASISPISEE